MKMTAVLSLILCLLSAASALAADLPFQNFQEMQPYVVGAEPRPCGSNPPILFVRVEHQGDVYGVWLAPETERVVIAYWPANKTEGAPTHLWAGLILFDRFRLSYDAAFNPDHHQSPCDLLYPPQS